MKTYCSQLRIEYGLSLSKNSKYCELIITYFIIIVAVPFVETHMGVAANYHQVFDSVDNMNNVELFCISHETLIFTLCDLLHHFMNRTLYCKLLKSVQIGTS